MKLSKVDDKQRLPSELQKPSWHSSSLRQTVLATGGLQKARRAHSVHTDSHPQAVQHSFNTLLHHTALRTLLNWCARQ